VGEPTAELTALQVGLVLAAAAVLPPGGRLVYSVCTLTRAETTSVVDAVLERLPGQLEVCPPPGSPWRAWGEGALLFPQAAGTDGMFVAVFERR